jgi:hypothetical protein
MITVLWVVVGGKPQSAKQLLQYTGKKGFLALLDLLLTVDLLLTFEKSDVLLTCIEKLLFWNYSCLHASQC